MPARFARPAAVLAAAITATLLPASAATAQAPAPERTITARFRSHFGCRIPPEVAQTVSATFAVSGPAA